MIISANTCKCDALRSDALRKILSKITKFYDDALLLSGIKITQFRLLVCIDRFGCCNLRKLSLTMGYNRSTLGRN